MKISSFLSFLPLPKLLKIFSTGPIFVLLLFLASQSTFAQSASANLTVSARVLSSCKMKPSETKDNFAPPSLKFDCNLQGNALMEIENSAHGFLSLTSDCRSGSTSLIISLENRPAVYFCGIESGELPFISIMTN